MALFEVIAVVRRAAPKLPQSGANLEFTRTAMPGVVMIEACVEMRETVSNWTTGSGCETLFVDVENAGLVGDPWYLAQYTDTDTAYDDVLAEAVNIQGTSNLVTALSCMGDTAGNDICSATDGGCSLCSFAIGCFTIAKP